MRKKINFVCIILSIICILTFTSCNKKDINNDDNNDNQVENVNQEIIYNDFIAFYWDIQIINENKELSPLYSYDNTPYKIYFDTMNNVRVWKTGVGYEDLVLGNYVNNIILENNINYYIRPVIVEKKENELIYNYDNNFNQINLSDNLSESIGVEFKILNNQTLSIITTFKLKTE
jgi:hypothetical protein